MSQTKKIPTGTKFSRWTVIGNPFYNKKEECTYYLCKCECGKEREVARSSLIQNRSKSCGCIAKEINIKRNTTHGLSSSPTHNTWENMLNRCNRHTATGYKLYGGRGIKVCDEWLKFDIFLDDMGLRPKNKQLDRINTNGNYCKENCHWVTSAENNRNTRRNVNITYNGHTRCLSDWANFLNIKIATLAYRIKVGWSLENAFTLCKNKCYNGKEVIRS